MRLWRIAANTRTYPAADLSGGGAAKSPGRWNELGQHVLYAAPTIAIAVLETAAHIDDTGLPLNRYIIEIDVPDAVWKDRKELDAATLPVTWSAIPAGQASASIGSTWLQSQSTPILLVPSVIVPEEFAALLNPNHSKFKGVTARVVRLFEYNRLFRGA